MPENQTAPPLPEAHIEHLIAGRARLRVPSHRRDRTFFAALADGLMALEGVDYVEVNPLTAGVLIHFTADPLTVAALAEEAGLFRLTMPEPGMPVHEIVFQRAREMNGIVQLGFGREVNLGAVAFAVFLITAVVQMARGNVAPNAMSAVWYAINAILTTRNLAKTMEDEAAGPNNA